ncbi:MAG: hypothetical protein DWI23_01315 [Planctomycetota bacterium]|nr:MAG: hypothetical protein DWI23_01315 [Planctomycetota bacterium]
MGSSFSNGNQAEKGLQQGSAFGMPHFRSLAQSRPQKAFHSVFTTRDEIPAPCDSRSAGRECRPQATLAPQEGRLDATHAQQKTTLRHGKERGK